jgi:hypothetical protein
MMRIVSPEQLDSLPHTDAAAIRSRRELRWINWIMGNHRWMARELKLRAAPGARVLELGAGDGGLLEVVRASGGVEASRWNAVDLAPVPEGWPAEAGWHQRDVFSATPLPGAEVVVANLFLHHFEAEGLMRIGGLLPAECRLILASEPARYVVHRVQGGWLGWLADFHAVTRHDMRCSIEAGFRGAELPDLLGLNGWRVRVWSTLLGAYRMCAWR